MSLTVPIPVPPLFTPNIPVEMFGACKSVNPEPIPTNLVALNVLVAAVQVKFGVVFIADVPFPINNLSAIKDDVPIPPLPTGRIDPDCNPVAVVAFPESDPVIVPETPIFPNI